MGSGKDHRQHLQRAWDVECQARGGMGADHAVTGELQGGGVLMFINEILNL